MLEKQERGKMQGEDFATMTVVVMDRMMREIENMVGLDKSIEMVVGT